GPGQMSHFVGGIDNVMGQSFGRAEPPMDDGSLYAGIEERSPDWEDAVSEDPVFQGVGGAEFFKTLKDWAMATGHLEKTIKAFRNLVRLLNDLNGKPAHQRLKAVRKWAKRHVGEPHLARMLKSLDDIEAELQRQGKLVQ